MNKLLAITGPTASGKTGLGIKLAQKLNGEIVSADSRQVYRLMDIGTGKDKDEYLNNGVKVWGIDLVDPDYSFNVSDYVRYATDAISEIRKQNKLPIVVGGTALYIKALLEPFETIDVPPDEELRGRLSSHSLIELQNELQNLDSKKWKIMNDSDKSNPRRLIRAIEVAQCDHKYVNSKSTVKNISKNDVLLVSLSASNDYIYSRIDSRVDDRMKQGAIEEIQKLLKMGYSFDLPSLSASGYKEFKEYFLEDLGSNLEGCVERWKFNEHAYARRQVTFINKFVNEQEIKNVQTLQINIEKPNWQSEVSQEVGQWYSDK